MAASQKARFIKTSFFMDQFRLMGSQLNGLTHLMGVFEDSVSWPTVRERI